MTILDESIRCMISKINQRDIFLGLVFLLFPIAHYKISVVGLPVYFSEIPLLIFIGFFFWKKYWTHIDWQSEWQSEKTFLIGLILFLIGATTSFFMNEHTDTGLGMLKSFFFLPVLLASVLILTRAQQQALEKILWMWLAGLATVAWTSLISASNGWLTYDGRLMGFYESPNYLAMLVAPGLLLSLYFFLTIMNNRIRWGLGFFSVILLMTLVLTQSYGALISFGVSLLLFLYLIRNIIVSSLKKIVLFCCFCLFVSGVFLWSSEKFQTLFHNTERSSFVSRQMIWRAAWKIGLDNPIVGIGVGNFQNEYLAYQKYFPPYLEWAVPQPHNLYVAFWLQAGIVGLGGFLIVIGNLLWRWHLSWKQKNLSQKERFLGALGLSLLVYYLIYGLIDTPYFKNDLALAFWGVIGMLFVWTKNAQSKIVD